ncbi:hypothetical protein BK816_01125 [Boudabousia tangfeifanii]|uniref:rRNA biogenesis protein rrp5 n=1 Tax=Boudabousia tangfeifanii TaxID=1912795 RepID=A0A1D9MIP4_9ACTO|nr:hypothetical protein [Boudabousia tangfeifanii]AOZ72068.1 hypothetical protein BK816_01125 [Boudabousia tangfeifanii]
MNRTSQFNTAINALNQISQAAHELAQLMSDLAWEGVEDHAEATGTRPESPAENGTASKPAPDQQAAPMVEDPPAYVPIEEVRAVLAELSRAGLTAQIKALIESFGASRLSEVAEHDLGALLEAARGLKTDDPK